MSRLLCFTAVFLLSFHGASASVDLKCVSTDVFDAGYYVVGTLNDDDQLEMQIESINNWTGNTLLYAQISKIVCTQRVGGCDHKIVDKEQAPKMILTVSMKTGPMLSRLNGEAPERFAKLNCEVSARLMELMKCSPVQ